MSTTDKVHEDAHKSKKALEFVVEGEKFESFDQFKTGAELKQLAGLPDEAELLLSVKEPGYDDEPIANDTKVNLARPDVEYFCVKKKLELTICGKKYDWYKQFISRSELIKLGQLDADSVIYLAIRRPWEDTLITDDVIIDLAREGVEHFYVKGCDPGRLVTVQLNNKPVQIERGKYTVAELKKLWNIPATHDFEEVIDGNLTLLKDNDVVLIKGCEVFFSHVPDGASS